MLDAGYYERDPYSVGSSPSPWAHINPTIIPGYEDHLNPSSFPSRDFTYAYPPYLGPPTSYESHHNQSSPVEIKQPITSTTLKVLGSMNRVLETNSTRLPGFPTLQNDFTRFKVWAGNNDAHKTGPGSLEYRLYDASSIQQQVSRLLEDLSQAVQAIFVLMTGSAESKGSADQDMTGTEEVERHVFEQEWVISEVTDVIDCLLRLDISIKNPTPLDRFAVYSTAHEVDEEPDVSLVRERFTGIDDYLSERLGRAMSRRRQYLKTNQARYLNMVGGFYLRPFPNQNEGGAWSTLSDMYEDGGVESDSEPLDVSQDDLKIPSIPIELYKRLFQCPYCLRKVIIQDKDSWERHILGDLRPYNCVAETCMAPEQEFTTAREWMQHMSRDHMTVYRCIYGCGEHFSSAAESREHLADQAHLGEVAESQVAETIGKNSQMMWLERFAKCPFCSEALTSFEHYSEHVGKHQRELALLAISREEYRYLDDAGPAAESSHDFETMALDNKRLTPEQLALGHWSTHSRIAEIDDATSISEHSFGSYDTRASRASTDYATSISEHSVGWDAVSSCSSSHTDVTVCRQCGKSFGDARQARRHQMEVHREDSAKYVCKCNYQARRRDNYLRHLKLCRRQAAPGVEVYICICEKPFTDFDAHLAHVTICARTTVGRRPNSSRSAASRSLGPIAEK
ncbi:hypothetical protein CGCSCA4_v005974 [Colletotrichum siamense]|uniref:C2H2-type domain-containing protein n=1 Tax=Colletotrichum siamense TaxID=690259 RepID=A0A9P5BRR2_COLSI|nr:hypothetical protein CGCSCA4_v005974 [Colletotrichum siamense]KAF4849368.1 hypothetical protein CGCSCA2_v011963 [Colletotrichum siamense]